MASRLIVVCDFDRTLFDTDKYAQSFVEQLSYDFGLDAVTFTAEFAQYSAGLEGYDLFAHTAAYGLSDKAVIQSLSTIDSLAYLYDDAIPFIVWLVAQKDFEASVVTTGYTNFQTLKTAGLHRQFPQLPIHIISLNKGRWLARQWTQPNTQPAILIDDNIANLEPLIGSPMVNLIHIQRRDAKYAAHSRHISSVINLSDTRDTISKITLHS